MSDVSVVYISKIPCICLVFSQVEASNQALGKTVLYLPPQLGSITDVQTAGTGLMLPIINISSPLLLRDAAIRNVSTSLIVQPACSGTQSHYKCAVCVPCRCCTAMLEGVLMKYQYFNVSDVDVDVSSVVAMVAAKDKDLVQHLESIVIHWTRQIKDVVSMKHFFSKSVYHALLYQSTVGDGGSSTYSQCICIFEPQLYAAVMYKSLALAYTGSEA